MTFEEDYPSLKGDVADVGKKYWMAGLNANKKKVKEAIAKMRIGIKIARDNPINQSTELAAQTQLDLIGMLEQELELE